MWMDGWDQRGIVVTHSFIGHVFETTGLIGEESEGRNDERKNERKNEIACLLSFFLSM